MQPTSHAGRDEPSSVGLPANSSKPSPRIPQRDVDCQVTLSQLSTPQLSTPQLSTPQLSTPQPLTPQLAGRAVVVVDVLRAFTTAAYAFDAGAKAIYLVAQVADALEFKQQRQGVLAFGEDHGRRPEGFDFPNSPSILRQQDLDGRVLVQRSSAGTQGVVASTNAERLWATGLTCATATARAVNNAELGAPLYVITGCYPDAPETTGHDDRLTARLIERSRVGLPLQGERASADLRETFEAKRYASLGPEDFDPADIELAAAVDVFDFAMEVIRDEQGLRLEPRWP